MGLGSLGLAEPFNPTQTTSLLDVLIQLNTENLKLTLPVWSHFTSDTMDQPPAILCNQRTILNDLSFKSFSCETFIFFSRTCWSYICVSVRNCLYYTNASMHLLWMKQRKYCGNRYFNDILGKYINGRNSWKLRRHLLR